MPKKAAFKPVTKREFNRVLNAYTRDLHDYWDRGSQRPEDMSEIEQRCNESILKMSLLKDRLLVSKMEDK